MTDKREKERASTAFSRSDAADCFAAASTSADCSSSGRVASTSSTCCAHCCSASEHSTSASSRSRGSGDDWKTFWKCATLRSNAATASCPLRRSPCCSAVSPSCARGAAAVSGTVCHARRRRSGSAHHDAARQCSIKRCATTAAMCDVLARPPKRHVAEACTATPWSRLASKRGAHACTLAWKASCAGVSSGFWCCFFVLPILLLAGRAGQNCAYANKAGACACATQADAAKLRRIGQLCACTQEALECEWAARCHFSTVVVQGEAATSSP